MSVEVEPTHDESQIEELEEDKVYEVTSDFPLPDIKDKEKGVFFDEKMNFAKLLKQDPSYIIDMSTSNTKIGYNPKETLPINYINSFRKPGTVVTPFHQQPDKKYSPCLQDAPILHPKEKFDTESQNKNEEISSLAQLRNKKVRSRKIKVVKIDEKVFDQDLHVFKRIERLQNLKFLKISRTERKDMPLLQGESRVLNELAFIDLSYNGFIDFNSIIKFLDHCPNVQSLDLRGNKRIENDPRKIEKILKRYPGISQLNGSPVTVDTWKEYLTSSIDLFKNVILNVPEFRYSINRFPDNKFRPSLICHLSLPNSRLKDIDFHEFENLESLNLADNEIDTLNYSGIERLKKLVSINLDGNQIQTVNDVSLLRYCDSILHIRLSRNPVKFYREDLIELLRFVKGSAGMVGIQSIDGVYVTIEEHLEVLTRLPISGASYSYPKTHQIQCEKFMMNIERILGTSVTKNLDDRQKALSSIRTLDLSYRGLRTLDLKNFPSIYFANLRGNFLNAVHGIENCKALQYLDLSHNKFLNIYIVIEQLKKITNLRHLLLARDCWSIDLSNINTKSYVIPKDFWDPDAEPGSIRNKRYRQDVLSRLLNYLMKLVSFDRLPITCVERYNATCKMLKKDEISKRSYKTILALLQSFDGDINDGSTENKQINIEPKEAKNILKKIQDNAQKLIRLQDLGLRNNEKLNFKEFKVLTHLNLANNKIHSLSKLSLRHCRTLEYIDVSKNLLLDELKVVCALINSLPKLKGLSIHTNPMMHDYQITSKDQVFIREKDLQKFQNNFDNEFLRTYEDARNFILKNVTKVLEEKNCFRILDRSITMEEVYRAHSSIFMDSDHNEAISKTGIRDHKQIIFRLAIKFRAPEVLATTNYKSLTSIDLSNSMLKYVFFEEHLPNLRYLNLSHNRLTPDMCGSIASLKNLISVDLSYNNITDVSEFVRISKIPTLRNIILNNQTMKSTRSSRGSSGYFNGDRRKFLSALVQDLVSNRTDTTGSALALMEWAQLPFKYVNNEYILPSELGNIGVPAEFAWQCAVSRNRPADIEEEDKERATALHIETEVDPAVGNRARPLLTNLDLSSAELDIDTGMTEFHFSSIKGISPKATNLSLANNRLTASNLMAIAIECAGPPPSVNVGDSFESHSIFENVTFLDLTGNKIGVTENDIQALNLFLNCFPKLSGLNFHNNPICNNPEDYEFFFERFELLKDVNYKLIKVNGKNLKDESRIRFVEAMSHEGAERFRTHLCLNSIDPNWEEAVQLNLSGKGISDLSPLANAKKLVSLNISKNQITRLDPAIFAQLEALEYLDISGNKFESLEDVMKDTLTKMPSLRTLNAGFSSSEIEQACVELTGCDIIDNRPNQHCLTPAQWTALTTVKEITGWYYPNHTRVIDLSEDSSPHDEDDIMRLVDALEAIAPSELMLPKQVSKQENASFPFISQVTTLTRIDGKQIDYNARANAKKHMLTRTKNLLEGNAFAVIGVTAAESVVQNVLQNGVEGIEDKVATIKEYAMKYGSLLSKWEIVITFQQILTQIIVFIDRIKWPKIYIDLSWLAWIFTIDLSFLSFFLDIKMPQFLSYLSLFGYTVVPALMLMFFYLELDEKSFRRVLVKQKCRTIMLSLFALLMLFICSFGIGFLFDFNAVIYYKKLTNNWLAWGVSLSGGSLLIMIAFWIFMCYFNKKINSDQMFWENLNLLKRRSCLFLTTVLYAPGCKFFVEMIQCDDAREHAISFPEVICLNGADSLTLVHIFCAIFGIVYAITIPVFFILLINEGVSSVDYYRGLGNKMKKFKEDQKALKAIKKGEHEKLEALMAPMADIDGASIDEFSDVEGAGEKDEEKEKKEKKRKADGDDEEEEEEEEEALDMNNHKAVVKRAEELLKEEKKELEKEYARQVTEYDHPAAYLYNQYKRRDRYKKVIDLVKKIVLMLLSAFAPLILKGCLASSMIFLLSIYQTVFQALISFYENILETMSQIGNFLTLGCGEILQFEWLSTPIFTDLIAPIILIGIIVIILIAFVYFIIRFHTPCCRPKTEEDEVKEKQKKAEEEPDEMSEMSDYSTLGETDTEDVSAVSIPTPAYDESDVISPDARNTSTFNAPSQNSVVIPSANLETSEPESEGSFGAHLEVQEQSDAEYTDGESQNDEDSEAEEAEARYKISSDSSDSDSSFDDDSDADVDIQ